MARLPGWAHYQQPLPGAIPRTEQIWSEISLKKTLWNIPPIGIYFCKPFVCPSGRSNEEYKGQLKWGVKRKASKWDRSGRWQTEVKQCLAFNELSGNSARWRTKPASQELLREAEQCCYTSVLASLSQFFLNHLSSTLFLHFVWHWFIWGWLKALPLPC